MSDAIVVLNAGSSSLKFSVYAVVENQLQRELHGQIEGLGTSPHFKAKDHQGQTIADLLLARDSRDFGHQHAFGHLAHWLREQHGDRLSPLAVGHRVVHGGSEFIAPTRITPEVLAKLEALTPLVPLHQPHNLAGVKAVTRMRADLPQVACFDTAFHQGRARVTERFGLPDELFQQGLRRWGFHGLSYQSIAGQLRQVAPQIAAGRIIVAHLGSGASMCAMKDGRCVDTTMSFSVLDGLPMGTRCGSLDPGALLFLLQNRTPREVEDLLYKQCGLLGISGISNDVRELLASESPRAAEAIEYFVYRAIREIGSLTAALGGLDALIFTAGIGENSPITRKRICDGLGWLGISLDPAGNERGKGCISVAGKSPSTWVLATDEESVIAAATVSVVRAGDNGSR